MRLEAVERNYDRLAKSYDRWNRLLSDPIVGIEALRQQTVDRLGLAEGSTVLDVGCGTGLNLPYLVRAVGPSGRVVALDYSPGMLDQARRRVEEAGWDNVELVRGDAALLDGLDGPFDGVVSTWAMGIVDDLPSALRRAVEVLRPGGRLAVLDFDGARPRRGVHRLLTPLYHSVLKLSGVDTAEDLDDERLRNRWLDGKAFLRDALEDVDEERYFHDVGFLLSGAKALSE